MSALNTLYFRLTYFPEKMPKFENQEQHLDFLQCLGFMVFYGLSNGSLKHDATTLVDATLNLNPVEIQAVYYNTTPSPVSELDDAFVSECAELRHELRPFVMAAVQHGDGKFGIHS